MGVRRRQLSSAIQTSARAETAPDAAPRRQGNTWMRLWTAVRRFVTLGVSQPAKETTRSQAPGLFNPLPGTRLETEQVAALLGVRPWVGGEAVKSPLTACRSPRVLHLATHAFALGETGSDSGRPTGAAPDAVKQACWENPLRRTGLALAGANRDAGEGRLTAWDVSGLDLDEPRRWFCRRAGSTKGRAIWPASACRGPSCWPGAGRGGGVMAAAGRGAAGDAGGVPPAAAGGAVEQGRALRSPIGCAQRIPTRRCGAP